MDYPSRVNSLVADLLLIVEGADEGQDERLDAVPESACCLTEQHAGAEPRRSGCVPAVVDPQRRQPDGLERAMPRPGLVQLNLVIAGAVAYDANVTRVNRRDSQDFRGLVGAAGAQMTAALKMAPLVSGNHQFKGDQHEDGLRRFLRRLMPGDVRVGTGFAFDALGTKSRQLDVLISSTTPFANSVGLDASALVPCEYLLGSAEVKTTLNREALRDSIQNAASIRSLRPFGDHTFVSARGRGQAVAAKEHRVLYSVVAISTDLVDGADWLQREWRRYTSTCGELGVDPSVIDRLIVPNRGFLDTAHANGHLVKEDPDDVLGMWFVHLFNHIQREAARRPDFDLNVYRPNLTPVKLS